MRFGGCDLRCRWCDSAHTWHPTPRASLQRERGAAGGEEVDNPLSIDDVVAAAERLELERHRFVSFTGGEPLLQAEAVAALAERLHGRGPVLHLETHGLAVDALAAVRRWFGVVSMDWKLTSDVRRESDPARGEIAGFEPEHERFLALAADGAKVVVKIVVTPNSGDAEIDRAIDAVARIAPEASLVLQPVTPAGAVKERPAAARMLALGARAEARLARVHVVPQAHPLLGVR